MLKKFNERKLRILISWTEIMSISSVRQLKKKYSLFLLQEIKSEATEVIFLQYYFSLKRKRKARYSLSERSSRSCWPKAKHLGGQRAKLSGAILRPKAYRVTRARMRVRNWPADPKTKPPPETFEHSHQLSSQPKNKQKSNFDFKSNESPFWPKDPQTKIIVESCTFHLITSREK